MGQPRATADARSGAAFEVAGLVQGVGFRPFVYVDRRRARPDRLGAQHPAGVVVEVEGDAGRGRTSSAAGCAPTRRRWPSSSAVREDELAAARRHRLHDRGRPHGGGAARTLASPDVATCADCLRELRDPADRRYRHPFITCTNCGPRFTIITGLPYDRPSTTMAGFAMCAGLPRRVRRPGRPPLPRPADRLPRLRPAARAGRRGDGPTGDRRRRGALAARRAARRRRILAVKGLGGYHLACDARNEAAVAELRRRKQRGDKPFAVMVARPRRGRAALVAITDDEERAAHRHPPADRAARAGRAPAPASPPRSRRATPTSG